MPAWPWMTKPALALVIYAPLVVLVWPLWRSERPTRIYSAHARIVADRNLGNRPDCGGRVVARRTMGRSFAAIHRHFRFGALTNFCAILVLLETGPVAKRTRVFVGIVATAWTLFVMVGLAAKRGGFMAICRGALAPAGSGGECAGFVVTGDPAFVVGKNTEITVSDSSPSPFLADPKFRESCRPSCVGARCHVAAAGIGPLSAVAILLRTLGSCWAPESCSADRIRGPTFTVNRSLQKVIAAAHRNLPDINAAAHECSIRWIRKGSRLWTNQICGESGKWDS